MNRKEEFFEKWDDAAEASGVTAEKIETQRRVLKPENGNFYLSINYNAWKNKRPTISSGDMCPFDSWVDKWKSGGDIILGNLYLPYIIVPNVYPGMRGHSLAVHTNHDEPYEILEEDLWTFRHIARDTGCNVNVNLVGSGATVPCHKHVHVLPKKTPLQLLSRKHITTPAKEAPDFPYLHAIFSGGDRIKAAAKVAREYDGPYVLIVDAKDVYFLPFRKEISRGFACAEAGGMFFVDSEDELGKDYAHFRRRMDEALIKKEECDIYELLEAPQRLRPQTF